ncbi:unnamed protein product [Protopolystoma xenopodis]|uniref:Uncharacterized protein n=1 Tax=Protopolystoma xenopodis TaxID=117903 RepID=A0A448X7D4_9PLAT|nr:unnamed protein product [Protopolystoma xenopodis]
MISTLGVRHRGDCVIEMVWMAELLCMGRRAKCVGENEFDWQRLKKRLVRRGHRKTRIHIPAGRQSTRRAASVLAKMGFVVVVVAAYQTHEHVERTPSGGKSQTEGEK